MNYHDDFLRIRLAVGMAIDLKLTELELDWPPPERIVVQATEDIGAQSLKAFDADLVKLEGAPVYQRVSCSTMSDRERLTEPTARMAAYIQLEISSEVNA